MLFPKNFLFVGFANCLAISTLSTTLCFCESQKVFAQNTFTQSLCQGSSELINQAREVTVQIKSSDGDYSTPKRIGSGVLVNGKDGIYVITVDHISNDSTGFDSQNDRINIPCQDFAQDNIRFKVVKTSPEKEFDAALLKPEIQRNWKAAEIATNLNQGETILASGFPLAPKQNEEFKSVYFRVLDFNTVQSSRLKNVNQQQFLYYKYDGKDETPDMNGLSGGSILNLAGKLVGIQTEFDPDRKEGKATPLNILQKFFAPQLENTSVLTNTPQTSQRASRETDGSKLPPVRGLW